MCCCCAAAAGCSGRANHDPPAVLSLPIALLAKVLQHIPLHQRLSSCALVSRELSAAAAVGTVHIAVANLPSGPRITALESWISKHGQQLQRLQLTMQSSNADDEEEEVYSGTLLRLPCAQLVRLTSMDLQGIVPVLQQGTSGRPQPCSNAASDSSAGCDSSAMQAALPMLKELRLSGQPGRPMDLSPRLLASLSCLQHSSSLTKLQLQRIQPDTTGDRQRAAQVSTELCCLLTALLQHLPKLSELLLEMVPITASALSHIPSSLTELTRTELGESSVKMCAHEQGQHASLSVLVDLNEAFADCCFLSCN